MSRVFELTETIEGVPKNRDRIWGPIYSKVFPGLVDEATCADYLAMRSWTMPSEAVC